MIDFNTYYYTAAELSDYLWLYPEEKKQVAWVKISEYHQQGHSFYFSLHLAYVALHQDSIVEGLNEYE